MAEQQNTYESPFTLDAIVNLTRYIHKAIADYGKEHGKNGKLDFFVVMASLGQAAYDLAAQTLPKTQEEKDRLVKEAKMVMNNLLAKLDGVRAEFGTAGMSDIAASAQLVSVLAEIYCGRRDAAIIKTLQDQARPNLTVVTTENQPQEANEGQQ